MHFQVESLGEEITSQEKKSKYVEATIRVETGHVMKALIFASSHVTEESFYYRGRGL